MHHLVNRYRRDIKSGFLLEGAMHRRTVEDMIEIARCGGSLVIYADTRSVDDLVSIAHALNHGASLTLQGMAMRTKEEIRQIVKAAPGKVTIMG